MLTSHYLFVTLLLLFHIHKELLAVLAPLHTVLLVFREVGQSSKLILGLFVPTDTT